MPEPVVHILRHINVAFSDAMSKVIGFAIHLDETDNNQYIMVPGELNPSLSSIIPAYGIGYDHAAGEFFVAALLYDEESGQILFPAVARDNGFVTEPVVVVFDHRYPGERDYTRYVAVVEKDPNDPSGVLYRMKEYVEAPAVLELTVETEDGAVEQVYLPLGSPILGILAPWLMRFIIAGAISVTSYALLKYSEAKDKAAEAMVKAVDYAIENRRTEIIAALVSGAAGARYERQSGGRLVDAFKRALAELATPATVLLAMLVKFMIIIELVRSMRRR